MIRRSIKGATLCLLIGAVLSAAAAAALFVRTEPGVLAQDSPTPTPGLIPTAAPSAVPDVAPPQPSEAVGSLTVTPKSGPIGTVVNIRGLGFPRSAFVYFFCLLPPATPGGPVRNAGSATVNADAGTSFDLSWPIPPELEPQQGEGGGPTPQADCQFALKPPYTSAPFTVTAAVTTLPSTGAGSEYGAEYRIATFCSVVAAMAFFAGGPLASERAGSPRRRLG